MIYDNLTPEQAQRAEALHAAATAFGSPADPLDEYLVRAGQWIVTGTHDALTPAQQIMDGGTVRQAHQGPVTVGRDFSTALTTPGHEDQQGTTD